jgi:acetylornithine deacetylase/succinyl-diaminopimelate desuccinylase-like protein
MIERLIGFRTVSRDSNLGLIEYVRDHLSGFGATTRLIYDGGGKKANLFATLGSSGKPGVLLSGHSDVVPIDGQDWSSDLFVLTERDRRLHARGSADMKGFIGIMLAQAPMFAAELGISRDRRRRSDVEIALERKAERAARGSNLIQAHVADFQFAETEIAKPEGEMPVVRVQLRDEPCGVAVGA